MSDETAVSTTARNTPATTTGDRSRFSLALSARDLLNVAIFAVIYFVIVFAAGMLGIINPLVILLTLPLSVIAAGIPYLLFLTRVRHAGMVTLFGVVIGVLYLIVGHPLISTAVTVAAALLAELVLWAGRYRSRWGAIWAYVAFSLWYIGPWLPLLINRAEFLNSPGMRAMGSEYIADFDRIVTGTALWIYSASTLLCGLLGGLLGAALLKKHFTRAGLA